MNKIIFILRDNKQVFDNLIDKLKGLDKKTAWEVNIKEYKSSRSLAQNNLYWKWMTEISLQAVLPNKERLSKDDWHEVCAMKFLGVRTIDDGKKVYAVPNRTSKLGVKKFSKYLLDIEAHFIPAGIQLTFPQEYALAIGVK